MPGATPTRCWPRCSSAHTTASAAFRINSQILPVKTHPTAGYEVGELPGGASLVARFRECGEFARAHNLRLSFHPDQSWC